MKQGMRNLPTQKNNGVKPAVTVSYMFAIHQKMNVQGVYTKSIC